MDTSSSWMVDGWHVEAVWGACRNFVLFCRPSEEGQDWERRVGDVQLESKEDSSLFITQPLSIHQCGGHYDQLTETNSQPAVYLVACCLSHRCSGYCSHCARLSEVRRW